MFLRNDDPGDDGQCSPLTEFESHLHTSAHLCQHDSQDEVATNQDVRSPRQSRDRAPLRTWRRICLTSGRNRSVRSLRGATEARVRTAEMNGSCWQHGRHEEVNVAKVVLRHFALFPRIQESVRHTSTAEAGTASD